MTTTETVIALATALGIGGLAREILTGVIGWLTGRQDRERSALRQAYADLDAERARTEAERQRADQADRRRRIAVEHAHEVRAVALGGGVDPDQIPPFPPTPTTSKETT